jgi:type II secretory pathway pseudopilin PulG
MIILGILAAIALPKFIGGVEKARILEATNFMTNIREQLSLYHTEHSAYTNNFAELGFTNATGSSGTEGNITYNNPPTTATSRYFTFTITAGTGTINATRRDIPAGNAYSGYTMSLAPNGTWGGDSGKGHPLRPTNE